jgi:hypothetical protein
MATVRKPMTVAFIGTSLTTGRLSADWVPRLLRKADAFPEVKGPVFIYNLGHGGWTSNDILNAAPTVTRLQPTHVVTEGGAINDCFNSGGGPVISPATHIANIQAFVGQWLAGIPGVDVTLQIMSPVSYFQTGRGALGSYYADELTTAAGLGIRSMTNPWPPSPLDGNLTNGEVPYSVAIQSGFVPPPGNCIFDAPSASFAVGPTGKLITRVGGAGSQAQIASLSAPLSGKVHMEVTVNSPSSASLTAIGIGRSNYNPNGNFGVDPNSIATYGGSFFIGGVNSGTGVSIANGDTIAIEVDIPNENIWFRKGGTLLGPYNWTGLISGPFYPGLSLVALNDNAFCNFSSYGDGLHPISAGAVDTYLEPNIEAWFRARAAAFWP